MKLTSRLILVLASLTLPNVVLTVCAFYQDRLLFAAVFGVVSLVGAGFSLLVWHSFETSIGGEVEKVINIKRFNTDMFSHVISYLPALIAFSIDSASVMWALTGFYAIYIVALAVSDVIALNPLFYLFGWRFQEVTLKFPKGTEQVVVVAPANRRLEMGDQLLISLTNFGLYLRPRDG